MRILARFIASGLVIRLTRDALLRLSVRIALLFIRIARGSAMGFTGAQEKAKHEERSGFH